jgi:hypothetical protein
MAMMACFALYRLDERAFVFLPGNLAVFAGLAGGALSLGLQRRFWLLGSLLGAALTAAMGLIALTRLQSGLVWMRLPGSPVIWVVVGLYVAFRLALIYQHQQKKQAEARRAASPDAADDETPGAAPDREEVRERGRFE